MKATLRRDTITTYLDIPDRRAFPQYIIFGDAVYKNDSPTSGDYEYISGSVLVIGRDGGEVTGAENTPTKTKEDKS